MGKVLLALLTGVGLPLAMMLLKRYFADNPNSWEEVFAFVGIGLVGLGAGVLLFKFGSIPNEGNIGGLILGLFGGWSMVIGLIAFFIGVSQGRDLIRETRAK